MQFQIPSFLPNEMTGCYRYTFPVYSLRNKRIVNKNLSRDFYDAIIYFCEFYYFSIELDYTSTPRISKYQSIEFCNKGE